MLLTCFVVFICVWTLEAQRPEHVILEDAFVTCRMRNLSVYDAGTHRCCKCPAGYFLRLPCKKLEPETTECEKCPFNPSNADEQTFMNVENNKTECISAQTSSHCEGIMNSVRVPGSVTRDAHCQCKEGFHPHPDSIQYGCFPHGSCWPGFQPLGQNTSQTKCEKCPLGTYSDVTSSTALCKEFSRCPNGVPLTNGDSTHDVICAPPLVTSADADAYTPHTNTSAYEMPTQSNPMAVVMSPPPATVIVLAVFLSVSIALNVILVILIICCKKRTEDTNVTATEPNGHDNTPNGGGIVPESPGTEPSSVSSSNPVAHYRHVSEQHDSRETDTLLSNGLGVHEITVNIEENTQPYKAELAADVPQDTSQMPATMNDKPVTPKEASLSDSYELQVSGDNSEDDKLEHPLPTVSSVTAPKLVSEIDSGVMANSELLTYFERDDLQTMTDMGISEEVLKQKLKDWLLGQKMLKSLSKQLTTELRKFMREYYLDNVEICDVEEDHKGVEEIRFKWIEKAINKHSRNLTAGCILENSKKFVEGNRKFYEAVFEVFKKEITRTQ